MRSLIASVVGVAPASKKVQPLNGPGSDTLTVLAFNELALAAVAEERPSGSRTPARTRARIAPRATDPRRTIALLQTQVERQRGEGEDQRDGNGDAVEVAFDDRRTGGRRTH